MRILYFLQAISPSAGGGEALFYNFAKWLTARGHEIHIVCYAVKGFKSEIQGLIKEGVKIHTIKPEVEVNGPVLFTYGQQMSYIINALRMGQQILKQNTIDVIHANTYSPIIPAFILGKFAKIPVVSTVHHVSLGYWGLWSSQPGVPSSASFIGPIFEKLILKMPVQMVHVVSNATRESLLKINPNIQVSTIYNGIDLDFDSNAVHDYKKYVIYIGRIVSTKNLGIVILAFKDVIKSVPGAKLLIIGGGPMRRDWEQLAVRCGLDRNVLFMGHVSEDTKKELLRSCSALVLPSRLEGFGRVIIEAFAVNKPVLVSSIKSLSEIVDNGIDGFLVSPDDVGMWAEKIKFVLLNSRECRIMGSNGRRKAEEKYSLGSISDGIEQLYMKVVKSKWR